MYVRLEAVGAYESDLHVRTKHLDQRDCRLTHSITPDKPGVEASKETLRPVDVQQISFIDGRPRAPARLPELAGALRDRMVVIAADGEPERCRGFDFPKADISVSTIDELTSGMVGTWHGCVTTPWTITYGVDVTLRADGTYSATSGEVLDGQAMTALYYGTDADSPLKQWWINDLQASDKGVGEIDIVFDATSVNRDELRNVKLMGDQLELELFHQGQYGPVPAPAVQGVAQPSPPRATRATPPRTLGDPAPDAEEGHVAQADPAPADRTRTPTAAGGASGDVAAAAAPTGPAARAPSPACGSSRRASCAAPTTGRASR